MAVAGAVIGEQAAYGQLQGQLQGLFGPSTANTVMGAVRASQHTQGWVSTFISMVTLMIGASTVLNALQTALNTIWESGKAVLGGVKGVLWSCLMSFGLILTLAFLLLISLPISTGIANVRTGLVHRHPALVTILGLTDLSVSLVIVTALFTLIYRYMPARRVPWKVVILGGFLTAVLFDL